MQNEKTRATVRIAGRDYTIASYDSPEYVSRVAAYVDRKMNERSEEHTSELQSHA